MIGGGGGGQFRRPSWKTGVGKRSVQKGRLPSSISEIKVNFR